MKARLLNAGLILSSLVGYLEWGGDNHMFLFQLERDILSKLFSDPASMIHPLIVLPIMGQIFLIITLFQKHPSKLLTYLGIGGIGLLLFLMFFIGLLQMNGRILLSTLPFLLISIITLRYYYLNRGPVSK